jgi:hypothetical protein
MFKKLIALILVLFSTVCYGEVDKEAIKVAVQFEKETPQGRYVDTLWFTKDEYANLTPADIKAMEQARIDNWLAIVSQPSVEPTKEQLQEELINKEAEVEELKNRIQATENNEIILVP